MYLIVVDGVVVSRVVDVFVYFTNENRTKLGLKNLILRMGFKLRCHLPFVAWRVVLWSHLNQQFVSEVDDYTDDDDRF